MLTPDDYRPSVDQVALLLRTRTTGGQQQGGLGSDTGPEDITTFDENTRPTDTEVEAVIDTAQGAVLGKLGVPLMQVPEALAPSLQYAVQLQAAILIEVSFFRETVNQELVGLWATWLTESLSGVNDAVSGGVTHFTFGNLPVRTLPAVAANPYLNSDPHEWIDGYAVDEPEPQTIRMLPNRTP